MPKEKLNTRPLLFIQQPEFDMKNFKMQREYSFKIGDQESTVKKDEEDKFQTEKSVEKTEKKEAIKVTESRGSQIEEQLSVIPVIHAANSNYQAEMETIQISDAIEQPEAIHSEGNIGIKQQIFEEIAIKAERANQMDSMVEPQGKIAEEETLVEMEKNIELEEARIESQEKAIEEMKTGSFFEKDIELERAEEGVKDEEESVTSYSERQDEIRALITRLARYPSVIEKPVCEAVIDGKKMKIQIISKRGDTIKVMSARTIKKFEISDFEELSIIPTWKGL